MVKYGQKEFYTALENGVKEFDNIIFAHLKIINEELKGIRFTNCDLSEVEMLKCNLKDIYFENCNIIKCNFSESELDYVEIYKTSVEKTDFSKCFASSRDQHAWSEVSFKYCTFKLLEVCADLEIGDCVFNECDFTDATIKCPEIFHCKLINSNMKNIEVASSIASCDFKYSNLENSRLDNIVVSSSYVGTNLKNAALIGCGYITLESFKDANLEGSRLWSLNPEETVQLPGVNLSKVDLEDVEWGDANLKGCNLEEANLIEADLEGANLEDANLKNVNLEDANLEKTNLKNANLEGANLEGTNLKDSNLEGVTILEKDYVYLKDYIDKKKIILK